MHGSVIEHTCNSFFFQCLDFVVCRPKLTWDESVKRDLREWNISKDLALDRGAWRLAINVPEP
jgi:hypothetical protein